MLQVFVGSKLAELWPFVFWTKQPCVGYVGRVFVRMEVEDESWIARNDLRRLSGHDTLREIIIWESKNRMGGSMPGSLARHRLRQRLACGSPKPEIASRFKHCFQPYKFYIVLGGFTVTSHLRFADDNRPYVSPAARRCSALRASTFGLRPHIFRPFLPQFCLYIILK